MAPLPRPADDDEAFSTMDFIAEARRPLLIERHRKLIEEMESSLSDSLISGDTGNPRLLSMLQHLQEAGESERLLRTMRTLADDAHYKDATLRAALVEHLCLLREEGQVEIATLQIHVIGVYRQVRDQVGAHQGEAPTLSDLRELPAAMLGRMLNAIPPMFGSPSLNEGLIYTPSFADRCLRIIRRLRRPEQADTAWADVAGDPPLPRDVEEPLVALPEAERRDARRLLVRDRIRSQFYRDVFLTYLHVDEFDAARESHPTVLHWLQAIEGTAHLYPFMQGQTASQKAFRLAHLTQKILQLHEMYARIALASQHPSYREEFAGKSTRERLARMAKDHYPPLTLSPELTLAALLCPFLVFVRWVQERSARHDFILPPDPKR